MEPVTPPLDPVQQRALGSAQNYTFIKYVKLILPVDGYVFWVRADLVSKGALFGASGMNFIPGAGPRIITPAAMYKAEGSIHYASDLHQEEESFYTSNQVVFNSVQPVQGMNEVGPNCILVGEFDGLRFAFSQRQSFFREAAIYHYIGNALYSVMETQLIDKLDGFDTRHRIVSNSLPAWLSLNNYTPFYGFGNQIPLYPSFLTPENMPPPYGAVHIYPESTQAITSAPRIGRYSTHTQLVQERVKVTLWGTRNFTALDFVDCVHQYSRDYGIIGMLSHFPTIRDEKRTQVELGIIAQKKSVEFEINYVQERINDVARQLILSAVPTFNFTNEPLAA